MTRGAPSVRLHAVAAIFAVVGVSLGVAALAKIGPAETAFPSGELDLPSREPLPASDTLMADADAGNLPDLLAGVVADGENPTADMDVTDASPAARVDVQPLSSPEALPPAPIAEVHTASTSGLVPMRSPSGRTAFRAYARPFDDGGAPNLSIVVGGLGIDAELTDRAVRELPPEVTLAFAAHAPDLQGRVDLARAFGHEVVLEIPMEGRDSDPGEPGASRRLRPGDGARNLQNLDYLLSRASGYFAVMPYKGDTFLARSDASAPILSKLESSGLGFLSDPQLNVPTLPSAAGAVGLPYRAGTMLVDEVPERERILADLEALKTRALAGEQPVGFAFTYPETLDALVEWTRTLEGVELAPVSSSF